MQRNARAVHGISSPELLRLHLRREAEPGREARLHCAQSPRRALVRVVIASPRPENHGSAASVQFLRRGTPEEHPVAIFRSPERRR